MTNNVKKRHPLQWIPTTWFAMGLPFVVLSTASAIMYKDFGISDTNIAFWTSLIMLPWTLKPLWGPFLEMFKTKKVFCLYYTNFDRLHIWIDCNIVALRSIFFNINNFNGNYSY